MPALSISLKRTAALMMQPVRLSINKCLHCPCRMLFDVITGRRGKVRALSLQSFGDCSGAVGLQGKRTMLLRTTSQNCHA